MMTTETRQVPRRTRWAIPATAVALGLAYLVAGLVGGSPGFGVFGLMLMLAVAAAFLLAARRSETVAGLIDRRDERINSLDRDASLIAGMVVLLAVLGMFVVELAQGRDGMPYAALGAVGGVSYVASLAFLRLRR